MIAIIDYGMGNLRSVEKGFLKVGIDVTVTNKSDVVKNADAVVLPGVGAFKDCMKELENLSLTEEISRAIKSGKPYLGICLGYQILFSESEEFGKCRGLDVLRGKVMKFDFGDQHDIALSFPRMRESRGEKLDSPVKPENDVLRGQSLKVPHMGWNEIKIKKGGNPLFKDIPDGSFFYFVHSYYVAPEDSSIIATTTDYGIEFASSVWKDNVYAVQFHPEKSQALGLRLLRNFGDIVKEAR
ncbi:MAG: imidazole glycerol phosphate synthase subunit HisH [Nitrospirae bacterium]|nr:imidazole glycerol phosphate synthase subunit HisH [Nitrospirota bacterium]